VDARDSNAGTNERQLQNSALSGYLFHALNKQARPILPSAGFALVVFKLALALLKLTLPPIPKTIYANRRRQNPVF
jgi:hypothetical protein